MEAEVDTAFIKNTSEMWLVGQEKYQHVELTPLFDFLRSVTDTSSQKASLKRFIDKWKSRLPKTSQNVLLLSLSGTWNPVPDPKPVREQRKRSQKAWEVFAREYDSEFTACKVNSQECPEFQPLNFGELLTLTFWKELYETFGEKVVTHIFRKCALIFTIEEGLFLYIASKTVPWYKKLTPDKKYCKAPTLPRTPKSSVKGNPYEVQTIVTTERNKRPRDENEEVLQIVPGECQEPPTKRAKTEEPSDSDKQQMPLRMPSPRWIKPRPEVLQKLIDWRNIKLTARGHIKNDLTANALVFVGIQEEAKFQPKDKLLPVKHKTSVNISKPKLPHELDGLKLPENLETFANPNGHVEIIVYLISDRLARQLNIRIKPKPRNTKKKTRAAPVPVPKEPLPPNPVSVQEPGPSRNSPPISVPVQAPGLAPLSQFSQCPRDPYLPTYVLPVSQILYNKWSWSNLPKDCSISESVEIYKLPETADYLSIEKLANAILSKPTCSKPAFADLRSNLQKVWTSKDSTNIMNGIILDIIRNHARFNDIHKLMKNCLVFWEKKRQLKHEKKMKLKMPSVTSNQKAMTSFCRTISQESIKKRTFEKLKFVIQHNTMMMALKQIFHILKVDRLLGSKRNIRGFFTFVRKAVVLGGIKSSLHLGELMALIHPEDTPIATIVDNSYCVQTFTAKLVSWLFSDYVLVLLKTCFYITEGNFSKNQLRFYLREGWVSASAKMKTQMLRKGALERLATQARHNSKLRFLPKQNNTLRSLLITEKKTWEYLEEKNLHIVNKFLHYVDAKVNKARMYLPGTLQCEWRRFVREWKEKGRPKLWYVKMDIRDAYPSVSLDKLKAILDEYGGRNLKLKCFSVLGSNGCGRTKETFFDGMDRVNWHSGIQVRPCIVIDQGFETTYNASEILNQVKSVINTNIVVKDGKNRYQFQLGLPQGWRQSPILCSIYYGSIDTATYLSQIQNPSATSVFMRIVDDYLFVSSSPDDILKLMNLMAAGSAQDGVTFNSAKSLTNVLVRSDLEVAKTDCDCLTFCGWDFCLSCGHVSRDFSKYKGQDFSSTITFQMAQDSKITTPEAFLRNRGTLIMPSRLKPILLDPMTNCFRRIIVNVFEAAICLSFRFYAICRVIYPTLDALKDPSRVPQIFSSINLLANRLASYSFRHAKYRDFCGPSTTKRCLCSCVGYNHEEAESTFDSVGNDHDAIITLNALKFAAFLGIRMKLVKHRSVTWKLIRRIDKSIENLEKNNGRQAAVNGTSGQKFGNHDDQPTNPAVYSAIRKLVGSKMPSCFAQILK